MKKLYALGLVLALTAASHSMFALKSVSTAEFNTVLANNEYVVVDFYADWCGPCKAMKSTLGQVEKEYTNVTFVAVNIDNASALANKFSVRSIPTVIFFKNGKEAARFVGSKPKSQIANKIKSIVNK